MNPGTVETRSLLLIGLGFFAAGLTSWTIPYGQLELVSLVPRWWIPAILVGAIGVSILKKQPLDSSVKTTTGFVAACVARVIYEVTADPGTHNLWPFEVFMTILIAFPLSSAGSYLCEVILTAIRTKK